MHASQTPQLYGHIEVRLQRFSASKVNFGNDLIISIRSASCQTVEFPLSSPKRCSIEAIAYPLLLPTLKSTAARGGRLASPKSLGASTSSHRAVGQEDSCATSSAVDSVGQGATISMMCAPRVPGPTGTGTDRVDAPAPSSQALAASFLAHAREFLCTILFNCIHVSTGHIKIHPRYTPDTSRYNRIRICYLIC